MVVGEDGGTVQTLGATVETLEGTNILLLTL